MTWGGRRRPKAGDLRLHFAALPTWCPRAGLWVWLEPVVLRYEMTVTRTPHLAGLTESFDWVAIGPGSSAS